MISILTILLLSSSAAAVDDRIPSDIPRKFAHKNDNIAIATSNNANMNRVAGYHIHKDDAISTANTRRLISSHRSLRGDTKTQIKEKDNLNALTIGIQNTAKHITAHEQTISIQQRDLESSGNSTLLIVGAVGAVVSIILLIGGLCYAKNSYNNNNEEEKEKKKESGAIGWQQQHQQSDSNNDKGNPSRNIGQSISSSKASSIGASGKSNSGKGKKSLFTKKPSKQTIDQTIEEGGKLLPTIPAPPPMPILAATNGDASIHGEDESIDDDDESNADFLRAREALENNRKSNNRSIDQGGDGISVEGDASMADTRTFGDDMSYAFTVEGDSLTPMKRASSRGSSASISAEDALIGAGGMSSFANEKGVFRWNEEGTKMMYTPKLQEKESNEQNGFVFDEVKKKWVVKEQVVGEKGVSFKPETNADKGGDAVDAMAAPMMMSILRSRSADSGSVGTGITGLSEFTYDDVALDAKGRTRSGTSISVLGNESVLGGGGDSVFGGIGHSPGSPRTPDEEGVEVTADMDEHSQFISNTDVDKFMDDDQTNFSGYTDYSNTVQYNTARPVTPERVSSRNSGHSGISDEATMATFATGDPGRIVPKKRSNKPNKMKIGEDTPFDEEIPFDERSRIRSGLSFGRKSKSKKSKKKKVALSNTNMLDDLSDDNSVGSDGSANSAQVLQDLDKLSKFMADRKQSSKNGRGSSRGIGRMSSYGSRGI